MLNFSLDLSHINESEIDISQNELIPDPATTLSGPDPTASATLDGLNWDGSLSVLMDSGLADASQMWLWAQDEDEYLFPQ